MEKRGYQEVEHTADWSLKVWAPDLKGLLASAAEGMFDLLDVETRTDDSSWLELELHADDQETLLVSWLEELLFHHETKNLIVGQINIIEVRQDYLNASVEMVPGTKPRKHIKAVTFHNLHIQDMGKYLQTEVVFDV